MTAPAIRAQQLGKRYRLGGQALVYNSLREQLTGAVTGAFRRPPVERKPAPTIWALKDATFEVAFGETVGILGLNGAGKTTLLKLLARITEPTEGRAEVAGRVGSLLEVGTGFHSELTGRENIYLSGAILGMRKAEIDARFEEIVAFAEVERFLDTPVKRYSSGMHMRLAFSVAAHLEPEILIVDEVLAVGDAEFQKKSLAKMREVGKEHRTVLFVSHNMSALRTICSRGILIEKGHITDDGEVNTVIDRYLAALDRARTTIDEVHTESFVVNEVAVKASKGHVVKTFEPAEVSVMVTAKTEIRDPGVYVGFMTLENQRLAGLDFKDFATTSPMAAGERRLFRFAIADLPLLSGTYGIELHLKDMASHKIEIAPHLFTFEVAEVPVYGGRKLDRWFGQVGLVAHAGAHPCTPGDGAG